MTTTGKIELMAPAGSFESLQAALDNGADSVYFGVEQLNMRAQASINFTLDDLPEITKRCNAQNVRTYLTLNTIVYDHDLTIIKTLLDKAKKAGVTAVIAMDQAVIAYARSIGMEIHISTQINITNIETLKFYAMFADTVVLSRELSLGQVKKIVEQVRKQQVKGPSGNLVEVEVFGHGALCMAVSGKCYMSLHTFNSSANRGACKQNCRKPYTVIDKESGVELEIDNEYIMSPKDLCTIDFLDELVEAGVSVLKIEGRGRAPEYVAKTVKAYREAIDAVAEGTYNQEKIDNWMGELEKVYNRGFWGGYYLGKKLGEWSKTPGSQATQKKVFIGIGKHYFPKAKIGEFLIQAFDVKVGDTILITGPSTGAQELEVTEMFVNDLKSESAKKGDTVTMKLPFRIRLSDKLYKMVKTEFAAQEPETKPSAISVQTIQTESHYCGE